MGISLFDAKLRCVVVVVPERLRCWQGEWFPRFNE
jgi:hypothetical protein